MGVNAYDVQICVWKMLRLSSKTCVDASINHPYVSSSLLLSFLLYIFFPLVFWILVYSTPLAVCSCVALSILRKPREGAEGSAKSDQNYNTRKKAKFATERVHSVRRRRAKEITREDETKQNTLDEFTLEDELATWHTLLQQDEIAREDELPKQNAQQDEIMRENENTLLQQDEQKVISPTNCDCVDKTTLLLVEEIPKEIRQVPPENDEETSNEDDHKNNVMDIGISDTERTKRLESLIARRRSRKMLNHQVRSSLMMNKNKDHSITQMANLVIPKIITYNPNKIGGPFSPGPGSAPSILIPMRNPFDLPYDPQEEKPDLTGDSFHQEFTSSNMIFSRHESFSLGPSIFRNRDAASSARDFGFRRAGYRFSRTEYASQERKFSPIMEQKSFESNSSMKRQVDDQIQVDENGSENHTSGESEATEQIPQSDFNSTSSSPSSEEDPPLYKIDREAVLKSLSSMRRNALLEIENNEEALGDNLSYANSALENATRLKQQYYDDKPMRRHAISYSIASDMQVEVSEVSSPPLTIDDDADDLWAHETNTRDAINDPVSRLETTESLSDTCTTDHEQPLNQKHLRLQFELTDDNGDIQSSADHASVTQPHVDSNDQQLQTSTISPKSVLISTLSLSNLDQDANEEAHPHTAESVNDELKNQENAHQPEQVASSSLDHDEETSSRSIDATSANNSEPTSNQNAFSKSIHQLEMVNRESAHDDELKIQENDDQSEEVAVSSINPEEETSSRSNDAKSANDSEATSNQNAFSKSIDQPEDQVVIRESTHDDERQTNSTSSNSYDGTKQVQDYGLSEPVEGNEANRREDEHNANSQGTVLPETNNIIDNDNK